ncbi:MAG: glycosyltransferase family 4 protein [bacterium]|nr:glycosyltransferase family 4 protein [bacterium]
MKILVVNDYFQASAGGFVVAYNLAVECRKRGHEIVFLTTVQQKENQGLDFHDGIPVYKIFTRYPLRFRGLFTIWNPWVFKEFSNILREVEPDIIHAHIIHIYLSHYVLKIACDLHIPSVLTAHDAMTFCYIRLREACSPNGTARHKARFSECLLCQRFRYVPFRNACLRHYINRYASKVISVSDALKTGLDINGIHNVETVHNGIDPEEYRASERDVLDFTRRHGLEGSHLLLFAGRSNYSKGLEHLVRAMPSILERHPNTKLLVLSGQNAYMKHICDLAGQLEVYSSLVFPGWLEKQGMKIAYAASDVCVVPSIQFEPFATVILEAMASKKPVVGSAVGGTTELIVDGNTGYVVRPHDISGLSEKICVLLNNPGLAQQLGRQGHQRIVEQFHIRRQADRILDIYSQAIREIPAHAKTHPKR